MATRPRGHEHRRKRAELLPLAYGNPCPLCGELMLRGQKLDLDHSRPFARGNTGPGDRMTHASCNRSKGASEGNRRRRRRPSSRDW